MPGRRRGGFRCLGLCQERAALGGIDDLQRSGPGRRAACGTDTGHAVSAVLFCAWGISVKSTTDRPECALEAVVFVTRLGPGRT